MIFVKKKLVVSTSLSCTKSVHEGLKKYKCDNCGKQYTQDVDLKSHITAVHEKKFCGKNFANGFNLKINITNCSWKRKKICEKGFGKLQQLITHYMLH